MEEGQAGQGAGAKECADFACAPNVFEDLCRALQIVGSNFYERSTPHSAWLLVTTRTWFRAGFEVALSLTESFSQPPLCSLKGPCTVYPMRRAHPFLRRHLPTTHFSRHIHHQKAMFDAVEGGGGINNKQPIPRASILRLHLCLAQIARRDVHQKSIVPRLDLGRRTMHIISERL